MTERRRAQPSANHQDHDRLLIVRLAGDDPYPGEAEAARTLIESCAACASLAADLRDMRSAMTALPVPRRTRDFRISDEQARSLRGSWLDRVLRRIASPGLGVVQPLAGAVMSIGIVLAVAGAALPTPVPAPSPERETLFQAASVPTQPAEAAAPSAGPVFGAPGGAPAATSDLEAMPAEGELPAAEAPVEGQGAAAGETPAGGEVPADEPTSTGAAAEAPASEAPVRYGTDEGPEAGEPGDPDRMDAGQGHPDNSPRTMTGIGNDTTATTRPHLDEAPEVQPGTARDASDTQPGLLLVALGAALAVLGLFLFGLRAFARRATTDRLLR